MTITAKYRSHCTVCGGLIRAGEKIEWSKSAGSRHAKCAAGEAEAAKIEPGPIKLSGGSGEGCVGWTVGQVILSGEKRRREGGPDALVIVTASRRYVREDGMSFGVGDESGYVYSATARPATPEEMAPAIEEAHGAALAMERKLEAERLGKLFESAERPDPAKGQFVLAGETIHVDSRRRLYGAGVWAVIEPQGDSRWIWWVRNNGADGDDWSLNNVRTGGAGAVGTRLPWSAELERRVRAVREEGR